MAAKPLTIEAIALTEKKMDMTLDDIIKMSKNNTSKGKNQRVSNRSKKFVNQDKGAKVQRFVDTRSGMRQGVLAQRRSNFQGNKFPLATEAAIKAAAVPIRNRPFNGIRAVNVYKPRVGAPVVQRTVNGGGFNVKQSLQQVRVPPKQRFIQQSEQHVKMLPKQRSTEQSQQHVKALPKQRPQTLDSLFADMKEQRMKNLSQHKNPARRNGGGQLLPPWQRARFG